MKKNLRGLLLALTFTMARNNSESLLFQLYIIRNQYKLPGSKQKLNLLKQLGEEKIRSKKAIQLYYDTLLFLIAYPDNKFVSELASSSLSQLATYIRSNENIRTGLFNSGVTGTELCASFSFEMVKWIRENHPKNISLVEVEADDGRLQSVLSVVLPKVESEILQDGNADWKSWFSTSRRDKDLLDKLISVFDQTDIRPEVKDELWNALGINVQIDFNALTALPSSLTIPYYHQSLIRKKSFVFHSDFNYRKIKLNESEAEQIIDCGRMILLRHLREIDPVTFTSAKLVSYYQLSRGVSVTLMNMVPERQHPHESYLGYVAFKNGLPVAYAGSWILFDSARIGLNVFPSYRGGESQYIFEQVMKLHQKVYHLKRFTVDPYQIGKDNDDGINSGAFWLYYHLGFRPIQAEQRKIAEAESNKIKSIKGYRSPSSILKKLADSRLELVLQKDAPNFDATDLSRVYANIVSRNYNGNRKLAEHDSYKKLVSLLQLKNINDQLKFVLKNWCVILLADQKNLRSNRKLILALKKIFELKANGDEELFIAKLQRSKEFRKFLENIVIKKIMG